jgi:hypothetical protein
MQPTNYPELKQEDIQAALFYAKDSTIDTNSKSSCNHFDKPRKMGFDLPMHLRIGEREVEKAVRFLTPYVIGIESGGL